MALLTFEASDLEKVPTLFKCSLVYFIKHTILSKFTVRYIVL
jgi:hypothetical protein